MTPTNSSWMTNSNHGNVLLSLVLLLLWPIGPAMAILPTGSIDATSPTTGERFTLLASQASFGSYPAMGPSNPANPLMEIILPPADDPLLCAETDGKANYTNLNPHGRERRDLLSWFGSSSKSNVEDNPNRAMLVPRGSCTFERKALSAQRLGATAVILYGTLDSRYALNKTILGPNATDAERKAADDRTYTIDDVLWPGDKYDYDCSYGRAHVPTSLLSFDPLPYNGRYNDAKLTGTLEEGNLCAVHSDPSQAKGKNFADLCPSKRCLLTGKTNKDDNNGGGVQVSDIVGGGAGGGTTMEACCAWDLHVWLYSDPSIPMWYEPVHIPAFYVTMEEGSQLFATMAESDGAASPAAVGVTMYARWAPKYNPSAVLIWALGVLVCFVASYMSASEYRGLRFEAKRRLFEMTVGSSSASSIPSGGPDESLVGGDRFDDEPQPAPMEAEVPSASGGSGSASMNGTPRSRSRSRSPEERLQQQQQQQQQGHYAPSHAVGTTDADAVSVFASAAGSVSAASAGSNSNANATATYQHYESQAALSSFNSQDESMELTAGHALGFVVMASCSLTILFVFKIYNMVKIMYAFGCSGAMTQVLFFPLWDRVAAKLGLRRKLYRTAFNAGQEFGPVTYLDLLAGLSGYGLGLAWLITAFYFVHPEEKAFFWIVQDIMGSCMCILFLSIIKLNSIRVAAILLIIAFFYDIFFVFVTPLLTKGGKSIMITVATSGGPPKADPSWCEKYPRDYDCKGGDPLPMLLTVPRLFDYQGGSSLLGLGDIVLPGLLLSFAARFDEAKKLVGLIQTGNTAEIYPRSYNCLTVCCRSLCSGGYLIPVTVAYAVGLCMANLAVYLMQMGQPALLYLVPCCLGTMSFLGWKKGELKELWDGPNAIRNADALLYGEYDYDGQDDDGGERFVEGDAAEERFPPTIAQIPPKGGDADAAAPSSSTGGDPLEVVTTAASDGANAAGTSTGTAPRKRGSKGGSGSLV